MRKWGNGEDQKTIFPFRDFTISLLFYMTPEHEVLTMAKPLDRLVAVGSMHRCTYTTALSTTWSTWDLSLALLPDGILHLEARFPLRCFQWLSLPDIATRHVPLA